MTTEEVNSKPQTNVAVGVKRSSESISSDVVPPNNNIVVDGKTTAGPKKMNHGQNPSNQHVDKKPHIIQKQVGTNSTNTSKEPQLQQTNLGGPQRSVLPNNIVSSNKIVTNNNKPQAQTHIQSTPIPVYSATATPTPLVPNSIVQPRQQNLKPAPVLSNAPASLPVVVPSQAPAQVQVPTAPVVMAPMNSARSVPGSSVSVGPKKIHHTNVVVINTSQQSTIRQLPQQQQVIMQHPAPQQQQLTNKQQPIMVNNQTKPITKSNNGNSNPTTSTPAKAGGTGSRIKDKTQLSEKKLRRLEKNRLSARECRRRKKLATQELQQKIKEIEQENLCLRLQLQIGQEAEDHSQAEQDQVTEILGQLLQKGSSENEIYSVLEEFKEKFADYGRDRRSSIEFHFQNILKLLMPTLNNSSGAALAMRALQGQGSALLNAGVEMNNKNIVGDEIAATAAVMNNVNANEKAADKNYSQQQNSTQKQNNDIANNVTIHENPLALGENNNLLPDLMNSSNSTINNQKLNRNNLLDPKALFTYLVNYLEVTPEQASSLKDSRYIAKDLDTALDKSVQVMNELHERFVQYGKDLEEEMAAIRTILSPTQTAKFLIWVSKNAACMELLGELWRKTYHAENVNDETIE